MSSASQASAYHSLMIKNIFIGLGVDFGTLGSLSSGLYLDNRHQHQPLSSLVKAIGEGVLFMENFIVSNSGYLFIGDPCI